MVRLSLVRFTAILMIVAMPIVAFADPVERARGGGSSVEWRLNTHGHSQIDVTVSTPGGDVLSRSFKGGQNPRLQIQDLGTEVEDGVYIYELRVVPTIPGDVAKKLEKARAANDDAAAKKILKAAGISEYVLTGAVTVSGGRFVDTDAKEQNNDPATSIRDEDPPVFGDTTPALPGKVTVQDQVIPDDLIVQGSGCFGFDCVNNESFGFDTIRLKENNLRIKAEDTSVGSFPTNDWQITFNDSASGGSSKFSVEDITGSKVPMTITAGATTNSIFVDSTGRVGFRTSTPVLDLHVNTSNTPAIRLEQNNSGGFTAQTWDIGANEANFFVRDVTSGSRLPFRIRPGAPTSSIDISADGEVGIGTGSPTSPLHLFASATSDTNLTLGNGISGPALNISYNGASYGRGAAALNAIDNGAVAPNPSLRLFTANVQRMIIDNEGFIGLGGSTNPTSPIEYINGGVTARLTTAGVWQDNSSRAAKEHITELDASSALKALRELQPVTYNYKVLPDDPKVGFIAEDVPEIVATPQRDGLSALDIVAVVTKVVQEQQKTIEELNARIAELEKAKQEQQ